MPQQWPPPWLPQRKEASTSPSAEILSKGSPGTSKRTLLLKRPLQPLPPLSKPQVCRPPCPQPMYKPVPPQQDQSCLLGVSPKVPSALQQAGRAQYQPWVSHSNRVPPHGQVPHQSFRRGLLPFVTVQGHCSLRLGRKNITDVEMHSEGQVRGCDASPGSSRGVPHLHNLVFRVDELDLWHVDAHGIACLLCLLSTESMVKGEAGTSYNPPTNTARLTPVPRLKHWSTGRGPWGH